MRSVVDDEVDAREVLERADVPALAADDAALEVVRSELDDRHRRLGRVARGDALERVGDERAGAPPRVGSCLLLHLPHLAGELVADEVLRAFEQLLARLVDGQARDLLERGEGLPLRVAELVLERLDVHLAIAEPLLPPLELGQPGVGLELLLEHALLDLGDLDAAVLHLALDLAAQRDGLLARIDLRLAANGLGFALRVARAALALVLGGSDARPRPAEEHDGRPDCPEDDSDERCAGREHEASVGGCRCRGRAPRVLSPGADLHGRDRTLPGRLRQVVGVLRPRAQCDRWASNR